jgi:hypothetical protein
VAGPRHRSSSTKAKASSEAKSQVRNRLSLLALFFVKERFKFRVKMKGTPDSKNKSEQASNDSGNVKFGGDAKVSEAKEILFYFDQIPSQDRKIILDKMAAESTKKYVKSEADTFEAARGRGNGGTTIHYVSSQNREKVTID